MHNEYDDNTALDFVDTQHYRFLLRIDAKLRTLWNLPEHLRIHCDCYELWRASTSDFTNKLFKKVRPTLAPLYYLTYKSKLYEVEWDKGAFSSYMSALASDTTNATFIVSFRSYQGINIALVQLDWKGSKK